jgi:hypothetical protein
LQLGKHRRALEARLNIQIVLSGNGVPEEGIASATRELLKDIRADVDPRAQLVKGGSELGTKGDAVTLGQIALGLVTGGPLGKLVEGLFAFLGRNRKLVIETRNAAGESLKIDLDFVNRHGTDLAVDLIKDFLKRGA